tara:strand:- start:435 stop:1118 length:684 start_codon:yes stop_codon:yes gene_type:complete
MKKILKFFLIIIIGFFTYPALSHVEHYEDLERIEFDIYRNNNHIGKHIFSFKKLDNKFIVKSDINFQIKKLGVVFYNYQVEGTEVYEDGVLVKFTSKTNDNKKKKYINMNLDGNEYIIDGSSYKGKAPSDFVIGTWWNHSIVKAKAQISAVSGRIIEQKVTFLGKETIKIGDKTYKTLHFNFSSTDNKMKKDKRLNTDIWYDESTLSWVKATFEKKGKWEYKLVSID